MKNYDILKKVCRGIFFCGSGSFWYEEGAVGDDSKPLYKAFSFILCVLYIAVIALEIAAYFFGDISEEQRRDNVALLCGHLSTITKTLLTLSNKEKIKKFVQDLVKVCESYETEILIAEKYRIIKINLVSYFLIIYVAFTSYILQGIFKVFQGLDFDSFMTYYPSLHDYSLQAIAFRIGVHIIMFVFLMNMILAVEGFIVMNLIMLKYKFVTLRHYFEELKETIDRIMNETGNNELASKKLRNGLIEGVQMQKELLRLSKVFDLTFGPVMAVQLGETISCSVVLLLQIALLDDLPFIIILKAIFYVVAVFFMLGLFLCNAGEITEQAILLSDSVFYSGWHLCLSKSPVQRDIRHLVLLACTRAQCPHTIKAFKLIDLTYVTFLEVAKSTYSLFALVYAQNK